MVVLCARLDTPPAFTPPAELLMLLPTLTKPDIAADRGSYRSNSEGLHKGKVMAYSAGGRVGKKEFLYGGRVSPWTLTSLQKSNSRLVWGERTGGGEIV